MTPSNPNFSTTPSDQDLAKLLSETRVILAQQAEYEADRVNRDLDVLLNRVRQTSVVPRSSFPAPTASYPQTDSASHYPQAPSAGPLSEAAPSALDQQATTVQPGATTTGLENEGADRTNSQTSFEQVAASVGQGSADSNFSSDPYAKDVAEAPLNAHLDPDLDINLDSEETEVLAQASPLALDKSPDVPIPNSPVLDAESLPAKNSAPHQNKSTGSTSNSQADRLLTVPELQDLGLAPELIGDQDCPGMSVEQLAGLMPIKAEVQPVFKPGIYLVLADVEHGVQATVVAEHLSRRLPGASQVCLAGAKSVLPGNQRRIRSTSELEDLQASVNNQAIFLVLVDSPVKAHQRVFEKIYQSIQPVETWVVADALCPDPNPLAWLKQLPISDIHFDYLAITNIWESDQPAWFAQSFPAGLLELAPASQPLWQLILKHCQLKNHTWKEA